MRSVAQTDPRYKNGIFVNTAGQRRDAASDALLCLPTRWGWKCDYWHTELKQQVYQMGGAKMVFLYPEREWFVDFGDDFPIFYTGKIQEITADVEREIESRLAAQWEAGHPDPDMGLEAVA